MPVNYSTLPSETRDTRPAASQHHGRLALCRNDMFVAGARELLSLGRGEKGGTPSCTLEEGVQVVRWVEVARLSSLHQKAVRLAEISSRAASA